MLSNVLRIREGVTARFIVCYCNCRNSVVFRSLDYIALGGFSKCGDRKKNKNKNWTWCLKSQVSMNFRIFCRLTRDETRQFVRGGKILLRATCFTCYLSFFFFLKSQFQSAAGNVIQTIKKKGLTSLPCPGIESYAAALRANHNQYTKWVHFCRQIYVIVFFNISAWDLIVRNWYTFRVLTSGLTSKRGKRKFSFPQPHRLLWNPPSPCSGNKCESFGVNVFDNPVFTSQSITWIYEAVLR